MPLCCGQALVNTTTTTAVPTGTCCLRTRYTCDCISGVDTWVLDVADTACIDNALCIEGSSCSDTEFVQEQLDGCVCGDPLPALPVPTCDPACCSSTTSTTSTSSTSSTSSTTTTCVDCGQITNGQAANAADGSPGPIVYPAGPTPFSAVQAAPLNSSCTSPSGLIPGWDVTFDLHLAEETSCCYRVQASISAQLSTGLGTCALRTLAQVDPAGFFFPGVNGACTGPQSPAAAIDDKSQTEGGLQTSSIDVFFCGGPTFVDLVAEFNESFECNCLSTNVNITNVTWSVMITSTECGCS